MGTKIMACFMVVALFSGCAYRHYLGMHGPSVKRFAGPHDGVTKDQDCLSCHHPGREIAGPPTTHPHFTGCLKCHNDDVKPR